MMDLYQKALRQGLREVKGDGDLLKVLPVDPEDTGLRRESLGVVEIPAELIDGTCNTLRRKAFSPSFLPLLPSDSEFAEKWMSLCTAHLEEGIRDPIKVVEYLHHFYVVEGHKRVSVLKYFGAITIPGVVTRLLPRQSEDPEVVAYYEFLNFYQMTGLNFPIYKRPGEYRELLEAMGRTNRAPWSAEEIYTFRSFYSMFREACLREETDPRFVAQAFLVYVKLFGYDQSQGKTTAQIEKELPNIKSEVLNRLENAGVALLLDDTANRPLFTLPTAGKLCAAFIHTSTAAASRWVYSHEYGRCLLERAMGDQVRTLSYEGADSEAAAAAAMEDALAKGADMIFTTDSTLLLPSVKQAVLHPELKILNCSHNTAYPSVRTFYPRLYEARFIQGAIAGTLAQDGRIGYVAYCPTYGTVAGINAFVQGARMVNSAARVYLEWAWLEKGNALEQLRSKGIVYIDYLDRLAANTGPISPDRHSLALIQCHWGRFYQSLIRRVLDGSWKKDVHGSAAVNYWWGMNQRIVDVQCSRRLPSGTRRLADVLRDALREERLDPFYGVLMNQQGHVVYGDGAPLPAQQILSMDWLSTYVEGRIPTFEEFNLRAQELMRAQGMWSQTQP